MGQKRPGLEVVSDRSDDHALRRVEATLRETHRDVLSWPIPPAWEGLLEQMNVGSQSEGDLRWSPSGR
jgi:hypothetical protein